MNSVKFLLSGLVIFLLLMGLNPASAAEINQQKSQTTSFFDFFKNIFQSFKNGFISQPKNQDNSEAVKNYYQNFIEAANRANFTGEEMVSIAKSEDSRVLLLEELIEKANQGTNLDGLKTSFRLWHQLDERVLSELNKLSINNKTLSFHQIMINWFSYHSKLAKQFSEENLSKRQINQLAQQFKKNAEVHMLKFKQSLDISEISKGLGKIFTSFIPQAEAFTCAAFSASFYHFGGRVTVMQPCNFGIIETISPPCGGLLLFTYPVLAANPYLWKKPTIGSAVLGRSVVSPNVCPLGGCPYCTYFFYEATVLYFGTSLSP